MTKINERGNGRQQNGMTDGLTGEGGGEDVFQKEGSCRMEVCGRRHM